MSDIEDSDTEHVKRSVAKTNLTFMMNGVDPRDLAGDGTSLVDFDTVSEAGGVRDEAPSCRDLALEGERLSKEGNHKQAIPLFESALEIGTDDLQLVSVLWSLLGNAHFYLGDYEKAVVCHAHDLAVCDELQDDKSQAQAYCNLAIANKKQGYVERARLCYERYLDVCEKLEDSRSRSKAYRSLGDLHLTLGRLKLQRDSKLEDSSEAREHLLKAAEYFEQHLDHTREQQNRTAEGQAHGNLGMVCELLNDMDKAIDHYEQQLKIATESCDKPTEGRTYCNIGNCLRAMIQPEKALECYTRGLGIAGELSDKTGEGILHSNIAVTHEMLCNLEEALNHHEKHLESMKTINSLIGQAVALNNMARTYEYMSNLSKAAESLEALIVLQKDMQQEGELIESRARLSRLNEIKNDKSSKQTGGIKGTLMKFKEKRKKKVSGSFDSPVVASHEEEYVLPNYEAIKDKEGPQGKNKDKTVKTSPKHSPKNSPPQATSPVAAQLTPKILDEGDGNPVVRAVEDSLTPQSKTKFKKPSNELLVGELSQLSLSMSGTYSDPYSLHSSQESIQVLTRSNTTDFIFKQFLASEQFKNGCPDLYHNFGDEQHRANFEKVLQFLSSAGEEGPVNLAVLQDWDGWSLTNKDLVIQPMSQESHLI